MRGVLFDLDGTLIRSTLQPAEAKAAILKKLEELGVETSGISAESTFMDIFAEARARTRRGGTLSPSQVEKELSDTLDRFDISALSDSELQEDVEFVLDSLLDRGFKLGVVTNSGRKGVGFVLRRLRLAHYFSAVVTRNDVQLLKPSGEGILKAIWAMGCDGSDVAFVGDTWVDVRAAKDAGVKAVALAGGLSPPERLERESPDVLVRSLRELLDIL